MKTIRILHIGEASTTLPNMITGIKTVLSEQIKYENKFADIEAKLYGISSKIQDNNEFCINKISFEKDIKSYNPTFVVFHGFYIFKHVTLAKILKKNKIPYYIKPHGGFNKKAQIKSCFKKKVARFLFFDNYVKQSNGIFFLNEYERENSIYHTAREFILPNGIEKIKLTLDYRNISNQEMIFIYFGRIEIKAKGIDELLQCILKNKDYFCKNKIKFKFYGNGKSRDMQYLDNIIQKMPELVEYCGVVYDKYLKYKILKESDVSILLSHYEGMPMSLIESLSVGTPCFITKETGIADCIQNYYCGWICNNRGLLFSNLEKCVSQYQKTKLKFKENALKASEDFDWENIMKKYYDVYKELKGNIR